MALNLMTVKVAIAQMNSIVGDLAESLDACRLRAPGRVGERQVRADTDHRRRPADLRLGRGESR